MPPKSTLFCSDYKIKLRLKNIANSLTPVYFSINSLLFGGICLGQLLLRQYASIELGLEITQAKPAGDCRIMEDFVVTFERSQVKLLVGIPNIVLTRLKLLLMRVANSPNTFSPLNFKSYFRLWINCIVPQILVHQTGHTCKSFYHIMYERIHLI